MSPLATAPLMMEPTGLSRDALAGDVALVTGGAGTIGLAVCRSLAWLGAKVVIAGRNRQNGEEAADIIDAENTPGTALYVQTDISDESSVKNLAAAVTDTYGKVDILLNNAMDMNLGGTIMSASPSDLDKQYAIAVRGTLHCIQAFVPGMVQRKHGVVSYIATTFRYPSGPSSYCAVKSATSSMMMSLAAELGPVSESGVAVFMYVPALVGRPRRIDAPPPRGGKFISPPNMLGYGPNPIPPEDAGAAIAYCIVRAADIHGSGVNAVQAQKRMKWPFPRPDTLPGKDFERLRDQFAVRMFGYVGPGWQDDLEPLVSVNRSDAAPGEGLDQSALF